MKVVILAGGLGTRMGPETATTPKPMIEIGNKPILWHIMQIYSHYKYNDFIICLGHKGNVIKDYFLDYAAMQYDCTIYLRDNAYQIHHINEESNWKITLANTGLDTQTGGRIKRIQRYVSDDPFMVTYGDGIANIDIRFLLETHQKGTTYGTLTGIHNKSRFGEIESEGELITSFEEKSATTMINGGFMVFEPVVFDLIEGDNEPLETGLLKKLTNMKQLGLYEHKGFWACCDSPKEVEALRILWDSGTPPWKIWR